MASPRTDATSLEKEEVENLINMEDIQKAFEALCTEEVFMQNSGLCNVLVYRKLSEKQYFNVSEKR